ncbi:MAG: hypothetical protein ABIH72_01950 [archaeon]
MELEVLSEQKSKGLSDEELSAMFTDSFKGGTLVEYKDRRGFTEEFGRARVSKIKKFLEFTTP